MAAHVRVLSFLIQLLVGQRVSDKRVIEREAVHEQ
jgi:hypothetical protein